MDENGQSTYTAENIKVLEGLSAVRKRPAMYIGSIGSVGLHHLVYEIVDNAVDEALAGYCNKISLEILKGNVIRVVDDGRGIPVGIHPTYKVPTLEVILTKLHSGGKFDSSSYKVSGGLHGVGLSVVNALSSWLELEIKRDGKIHKQRYERGDIASKVEIIGDIAEDDPVKTGTIITFKADPEIFVETTVYNYDTLKTRIRETAFLTKGLYIEITDSRSAKNPYNTSKTRDIQENDCNC